MSLMRAMGRHQRVEDLNKNELIWVFSSRLLQKDKAIVEALRSLIEEFRRITQGCLPIKEIF